MTRTHVQIDAVRSEDIPAIAEIAKACGFPARSPAGWNWLLFDNPEQHGAPAGQLMRGADGEALGFLGTMRQQVQSAGRTRQIITGHSFVMAQRRAGLGRQLVQTVLDKSAPVPVTTLKNNAASAPVLKKVGMRPWIGSAGQSSIDWPLRPWIYSAGRALSYAARNQLAYGQLARREWLTTRLQWPIPESQNMALNLFRREDWARLDAALKVLNAAPCENGWRIARSLEGYRWRLADPDAPGRSCVFLHPAGHVAMVTLAKLNKHEPAIAQITDLAIAPIAGWESDAVELLRAIHRSARAAGAAALRLSPVLDFPVALAGEVGSHRIAPARYDSCHIVGFDGGLRGDEILPALYAGEHVFASRVAPVHRRPAKLTDGPVSARPDTSSSAKSLPSAHARTTGATGW
jgi:hypothetical protein